MADSPPKAMGLYYNLPQYCDSLGFSFFYKTREPSYFLNFEYTEPSSVQTAEESPVEAQDPVEVEFSPNRLWNMIK